MKRSQAEKAMLTKSKPEVKQPAKEYRVAKIREISVTIKTGQEEIDVDLLDTEYATLEEATKIQQTMKDTMPGYWVVLRETAKTVQVWE